MEQLKVLMILSYFIDIKVDYAFIRKKINKYLDIRFKSISRKTIESMVKQIAMLIDDLNISYSKLELDFFVYGLIVQAGKADDWQDICDVLTEDVANLDDDRAIEIVKNRNDIIDKIIVN